MKKVTVTAPCGEVTGIVERGMKVFRGVPYAEAERFALPHACKKAERYDATHFGNCCPQDRAYFDESKTSAFYHAEFRKGLTFSYGEDCLNLNVYAPECGDKLPVVLFIHGGSFVKGSSDERATDGEAFCRRGVVLVSANYRLNAFGMLSDGSVPFNLALYDQLAALSWVKKNISAFGGDPDNITLAGQSAGAISVQILVLNSEVKRDVARAFMMSGGGFLRGLFAPHSPQAAERFARRVVKEAGVADFSELKNLSAKELYLAWKKAYGGSPAALLATLPVMDGVIAKRDNYSAFAESPQVDVMFGVTGNDMVAPLLRRAVADYARRSPAACYGYLFGHELPGGGKRGTWHSCDLWYVFGSLERSDRPFGDDDREVSRRLTDAVCSFARCGTPQCDGREWGRLPGYVERIR